MARAAKVSSRFIFGRKPGSTENVKSKPRKKQDRVEQRFHLAVAAYLDAVLDPRFTMWLHVPNGGARSPVEAGILKAMGVRAGWPDIMVVAFVEADFPTEAMNEICLIELKRPDGKPSEAQRDLYPEIKGRLALDVYQAETLDGVKAALEAEGIPMRVHTLYPTGGYVVPPSAA